VAAAQLPRAEPGHSQVDASIAGTVGQRLAVVVKPIGFNRDIALALIPAMAAREVAVSSLATTYAVDSPDKTQTLAALGQRLKEHWSLPTALAFSPGSCSRRSACRPSPSPGVRRMGGNGQPSCSHICSAWPTFLRA